MGKWFVSEGDSNTCSQHTRWKEACICPRVRHRTHVPELVGVSHRADRLDSPAEHIERHRASHVAVPIAKNRARLAVHLAWLHSRVDPGEHRGRSRRARGPRCRPSKTKAA